MAEFYMDNAALIERGKWTEAVAALRTEVERFSRSMVQQLKQEWMTAFESAIISRASKDCINGLLFSGGVDSTIIGYVLHKHNIPFICYTVGFKDPRTKDPEDVIEAERIATQYGWQHRTRLLTLDEFAPIVNRTAQVLGDVANPVTVGVGAVVIAAAELALAEEVRVLFGGLGSEEIFAGYHRHDKANQDGQLDQEGWRGLDAMYERDLVRDSRIGTALGITVPTPFMDLEVIKIAMQLPSELKIKDGVKKYILRVIATEYGLKEEFAFRPKRAAQYGSRTHKAISRLAKRAGLTEEAYIKSLHHN